MTGFQLVHVKGDLLASPYPIVHCVSANYKFGVGVAYQIEQKWHIKEKLFSEHPNPAVGCMIPVWAQSKLICNLVTKDWHSKKPTFYTLGKSLRSLRAYLREQGILEIAAPRLASGHDRLPFPEVEALLRRNFQNDNLTLYIYSK